VGHGEVAEVGRVLLSNLVLGVDEVFFEFVSEVGFVGWVEGLDGVVGAAG